MCERPVVLGAGPVPICQWHQQLTEHLLTLANEYSIHPDFKGTKEIIHIYM